MRLLNKPQQPTYTVAQTVERLKQFEGAFILQTMFLRGTCAGERIDNTTEEELTAWLARVAELRPKQVMVYSIDRDTPCQTLEKVSRDDLQKIAARVEALGINCSVA